MKFTMAIRLVSFIVTISICQPQAASFKRGRQTNEGAHKYSFTHHGGSTSGHWLFKPHLQAKSKIHDRIQRNQVTVQRIVEAARANELKRAHDPASPSHTFVYPAPSPIHTRLATAHMPAPTSMHDSILPVAELFNETWMILTNPSMTLTAASSTGLSNLKAIQPKSTSNNDTQED
ncbi:hypothetical protein DFH28DRAFT_1145646 [Melampsora americana]|nr:hypothetical protein DFH28DRAFT_1145646 [Melampsora americana]